MKKGYLYVFVTLVMFTSYEVILKYIAGQINSVQLTLCRFTIGFFFLLPLAVHTLNKRNKKLDAKCVAYFALLGLLGIALSMPILNMSVMYTGSSVAAVLFSCNPVFVTVMAFFLLQEPIKVRHIAALVLEVLGAAAIIDPRHSVLDSRGVILAVVSTLLFSLYGVMGKRKCTEFGGAVVSCFSFLFGSLFLLSFILLSHVPAIADAFTSIGLASFANIPIFAGYTLENLPYVLFVSVGVAGIGFCCYFLAMECLPASVVSLVYFFKPALAPVLAWQLHGEVISVNMLLGILLIVSGSLCYIVPGLIETRRVALIDKG